MNVNARIFLICVFCFLPLGANAFDFVKRLTSDDIPSDKPAYRFNKTVDPITDEIRASATYNATVGSDRLVYACKNYHPSLTAYFQNDNTNNERIHDIALRFDKTKPIKTKARYLTLKKRSDIKDIKEHFEVIQRLLDSNQIAVRILDSRRGYGDENNNNTAVFDIPEIKQAITKVNAAAGCADLSEYNDIISYREKVLKQSAVEASAEFTQDFMDRQTAISRIMEKVDANWKRPPGSSQLLSAEVRVRLGRNGSVLLVSIIRSSGDLAFDRAVEAAINRADPLPMPTSQSLLSKFRDIKFVFKPDQKER